MKFKAFMPLAATVATGILAVFLPLATSAATVPELQAQLQAALSQIEILRAHPDGSVLGASTDCPNLTHHLSRGSRGIDVAELQRYLIAHGNLASGNDTGYFGSLTERAVKDWQSEHNIVSSGTPATTGHGAVGPGTRTVIHALCVPSSSSASSVDQESHDVQQSIDTAHTTTTDTHNTSDSTTWYTTATDTDHRSSQSHDTATSLPVTPNTDTTIILVPSSLFFTSVLATASANPPQTTVQVSAPAAWSATTAASWLDVHCATGNCGGSLFIVVPTRFNTLAPGTYDASVTVRSGRATHILPLALMISGAGTEARTAQPAQATPPSAQTTSTATITIDPTITYQTMEGFGTSERVFDDPHLTDTFNSTIGRSAVTISRAQQDEILDKLYIDLGLTRVRPVNPDTAVGWGIEPTNDNNDPNVADLTKFNFSWKNLDDHCDYIKRAQTRGAITAFLSPLNRESWMGVATTGDVGEYAEWLLAQIKRCDALGVRLPFVSISNEPSLNSMSGAFIRDVIKVLGPRLRSEGFKTMFVVPDDVRASNAAQVASVILADPVARSYVGALATHLYDEPVSYIGKMRALSTQYGISLWMTEFSAYAAPTASLSGDALGWANLMQDLIGAFNVSAIDYMWGFFGQYSPDSSQLITLNSQGNAYTGYRFNKEYYVTGQYSRFVKPGAQRIAASSNDSTLKATAFKDGNKVIAVVVNNQPARKAITIQLSGSAITTMYQTYTALRGTDNWKTSYTIAVTAGQFTATIPGESISTFVSTP